MMHSELQTPPSADYGLIGRPLGHSFSPGYFNDFFEREGLPWHYEPFELATIDELPHLLAEHPELRGLNVTLPYKREVLRYVQACSPEVKALGAANVIKVSRSAQGTPFLEAYNTDVEGFRSSLLELLGEARPKALVFGTGGAAAAICYVLHALGIPYRLVSRSAERGDVTYEMLASEPRTEELLWINATPQGLRPEERLPLPYDRLTPAHYAFDLIYNPSQTAFLHEAALRGARWTNGLQMLYRQADEAWRIWNTDAL